MPLLLNRFRLAAHHAAAMPDDGDSADAVVARLQAAAEETPDLFSFGALGECLMGRGGNGMDAAQAFERALSSCAAPPETPAHLARAYAHYCGSYASLCEQQGNVPKAGELYEAGLRARADCPLCVGNHPLYLQVARRPLEDIEAAYERALEIEPPLINVMVKYANFLRHGRRAPDRAEAMLERALAADGESPEALGAYGVLLHAIRPEDPRCEDFYRKAVKRDPTAVNTMSNYGLYLSEVQRDYDRARKVYEKALAVDPTHANSCYNYAVMLDAALKDVPAAAALYERAIDAKPTHAYALYNLAVLCEEKLQDPDRAGALYRRAVAAAPNDALAIADLGRFLAQRALAAGDPGAVKEGEALLSRALALDPRSATAHAALGEVRLFDGDAKAAKAHLAQATASDPNASGVRRLADLLARGKR